LPPENADSQRENLDTSWLVKVDGLPEALNGRTRIVGQLLEDALPIVAGSKVQLDWYGYPPVIQAGDVWKASVHIQRWQRSVTEDGIQISTPLLRRGIVALATVKHAQLKYQNPGLIDELHRVRFSIAEQVSQRLQQQPLHGLINALGLGERSGISEAQWDIMNSTGTTHLMAISGLHVGLFAGWVYFLVFFAAGYLLKIFPGLTARRIASWAAIAGALLYSAMAGFSVPTQRALVMCVLVLGFASSGRRVSAIDIVAMAVVAVLIIDPMAWLAAGFYLSFFAVTGIFWLMLYRRGQTSWLGNVVKIQLALSLLMLPIIILLFARVSWVSPLANVIAIPWVSWAVVPFAIIAVLLGLINPAWAVWPAEVAAAIMQPLWSGLQWLADINQLGIPIINNVNEGFVLCLLVAAILITLPRGMPGRALGYLLWLPWLSMLLLQ